MIDVLMQTGQLSSTLAHLIVTAALSAQVHVAMATNSKPQFTIYIAPKASFGPNVELNAQLLTLLPVQRFC